MSINELVKEVHAANANWWRDLSSKCEFCRGRGEYSTSGTNDYENGCQPSVYSCGRCEGTGYQKKDRNTGELLMLITSELAEAMEGDRKNLMDDKLPHRKMFEVEIADALIRLLDLAGGMSLDLQGAYEEKMAFNRNRADHKIENRLQPNGKIY